MAMTASWKLALLAVQTLLLGVQGQGCVPGCTCSSSAQTSCVWTAVCPETLNANALAASYTTVSLTNSSGCGTTMTRSGFSKLTSLSMLRIDGVSSYQVIDANTFNETALTSLTIINTNLQTLIPGSFDGLHSLITLALTNNQINSIPDNLFQGLSTLTSLTLDNNQLTLLADNTFNGLVNLLTLSLTFNKIAILSSKCFHPLVKLRSLRLSGNQLTILPDYFLAGVPTVALFADSNRLTTIQPNAFGNSSLTAYKLDNNLLTEFPTTAFQTKPKIGALILTNNLISMLSAGDVSGLTIASLSLDNNPLKQVDPRAFQGTKITTSLSLLGTQLTSLPQDLLASLPPITANKPLLLNETGWTCDCDALWLAQYLAAATTSRGPTCDANLAGINLKQAVPDIQTLCLSTTTTTPTPSTTTTPTTTTTTTSTSTTTTTTQRTSVLLRCMLMND